MNVAIEREVQSYVATHRDRVVEIARDLIRVPSENRAPLGAENECQQYIATFLRNCGYDPLLYTPDEAPGLYYHPLYWPGRPYKNRPNVGARRGGAGGGRSLVLSGHIDTVPAGAAPWQHNAFGGDIEDNRLFGRGANDMKAGVAMNLFVIEALTELGIQLAGDLIFESVVDEEFGGVNGTLAGRLMGFNADAAVITEPSFLRICPAQRGGRTAHFRFSSPNGGILGRGAGAGVIEQLRLFLNAVGHFANGRRKRASAHALYRHLENPVPVAVTRVFTAPWGASEPTNVPPSCLVELFWQAMPGETLEDIDQEFLTWFNELIGANPETFTNPPELTFPIRWLPGSAISADQPVVRSLSECATEILGARPLVQGIEGPCDMYVFHQFDIPTVLWGPRGGNTHNADEYVEIDSLVDAAKTLVSFVCRWCGVAG
jgi:acetylornithine deacetylase